MRRRGAARGAWIAGPLVALGAGCSSPAAPVAPTPPAEQRPAGKCGELTSQPRPLVTEWPASEKSRLEALLSQGGIAVAYAGCELRPIEGCKVGGAYRFKRTSSATDQIEIQSEEDLYAKLPLGALRLEGALRRSGRLAVKTTVIGQFNLAGASPRPDDPQCAEATHVIDGLGVGGFKMLAGGKASGSVDAAAGPAGLGAAASRDEVTLTEAGDEKACAEARGEEAPERCRSPIQLYLSPFPGRAAAPQKPRHAPSWLEFEVASGGERWVFEQAGRPLCDLPCKTRFDPSRGAARLVGPGGAMEVLPRESWNERSVRVRVQSERGSPWVFWPVVVTGGSLALARVLSGTLKIGDRQEEERAEGRYDLLFGAVFAVGTAGFGYWYRVHYQREMEFSSEVIGPPHSARLRLSPFGLSGEF
jgi:hypothetical protein